MDVGAGAGRLAVPLSRHCRKVTAVEPSEAMRARLAEMAEVWDVNNLKVVPERWEDASPDPAEIVVCAHVVYTVTDSRVVQRQAGRIRAGTRRRRPVRKTCRGQLLSHFGPRCTARNGLSCRAHRNTRPSLEEMGIDFQVHRLPPWGPEPFADLEAAVNECSARLFVEPGSEKSDRLKVSASARVLSKMDGGVGLRWAESNTPWLITWQATTEPAQSTPSDRRAIDHEQHENRRESFPALNNWSASRNAYGP